MTSTYDVPALMKLGIDRNMVCYDYDAKSENLTPRLLCVMQTTSRRNGSGRIKQFLVKENVFLTSAFDKELYRTLLDSLTTVDVDPKTIYEQENCAFPSQKTDIVIGICENGQVLLGAF